MISTRKALCWEREVERFEKRLGGAWRKKNMNTGLKELVSVALLCLSCAGATGLICGFYWGYTIAKEKYQEKVKRRKK